MFNVNTQQYSGPLDKLLELIEGQKLEITRINLAEVTASFLDYIKGLGAESTSGVLADFLVVAAKLILIKSKVLLPDLKLTEEEESDIKDLEGRLKIYKEFKRASQHIGEMWGKNKSAFARPFFMNLGDTSVFYPPQEISVNQLTDMVRKLLASLKALIPQATIAVKEIIITIEEKMKELASRFQEAAEHTFKNIASGKSKKEIIVSFLAILHLLRDRLINADQQEQFGDITFKKL